MSDNTIRIAGYVNDSVVDGPGIRFVIFLQGCPRRCEGCHNPQTHDFDGGYNILISEVWDKIQKNPLLSGVTLSGGEPFCQAEQLYSLAKKIKDSGLELAAYSGYTFEELISDDDHKKQLLSICDVLIDGEFVLSRKNLTLPFRGSDNQRILSVKQSLLKGSAVLEKDGRWNP